MNRPRRLPALLLTLLLCAPFPLAPACPDPIGARPSSDPPDPEQIRALFAEYLRLHAAKDLDGWAKLFLPEAICVRAADDGVARVYPIAEMARGIAETAKTLDSQHETFADADWHLEVHGRAALFTTSYTLFHNRLVQHSGRAYFSLVKTSEGWRIASLVWYRDR